MEAMIVTWCLYKMNVNNNNAMRGRIPVDREDMSVGMGVEAGAG